MESISSKDAFGKLVVAHSGLRLLDLRSEGEFAQGSFFGAINIPILNNAHRHQVGLCYKLSGQDAAIRLGHGLVDPLRSELALGWREALEGGDPESSLAFCWRGGLRSRIACEWMKEAGISILRVEEGFKGLRREALNVFGKFPRFLVLGGMTGSGKTRFLKEVNNSLDLEGLASHRGSAFGLFPQELQPVQMNFENSLALIMARKGPLGSILVEDESRQVGRLTLPHGLYECLACAPLVYLQVSDEQRGENIYAEYVVSSLAKGITHEELCDHFIHCTRRIQRRLGGLAADQLIAMIRDAFEAKDKELHLTWIKKLLESYYDPLYRFSMNRKNVVPVFSGNWEECLAYVTQYQANEKA
jgi:tRNA 2-selenouridine synthase